MNRSRDRNGSRNRNKYGSNYLNRSTNSNISSSSSYRQRGKYQRSSSAPRFTKNRSSGFGSRSRSPSVRFDPTAWAKEKQKKIERAKLMRGTFGKSRSPSPFRRTSRSASPSHKRWRNKGNGNLNKS